MPVARKIHQPIAERGFSPVTDDYQPPFAYGGRIARARAEMTKRRQWSLERDDCGRKLVLEFSAAALRHLM
jgi:hypothetical protein